MKHEWTPERIQWFLSASAYTDFHTTLAQFLVPYLNSRDTLCDLGCGLGRLDLALSPYVSRITAIDRNALVIAQLQRDSAELGIENITAVCAEAHTALQEHDAFLFSFFGAREEVERCLPYCRKKMIRITKIKDGNSLFPKQDSSVAVDTVAVFSSWLAEQKIPCEFIQKEFEFGQPFTSEGQAVDFVRFYAPQFSASQIDSFLRSHLQPTGRSDFPLYLPNKKNLGIFIATTSI